MIRRCQQLHWLPQQIEHPPLGIISVGQIRLIAAHPGVDHPIPQQLQRTVQTR
jgi:hypothetical protein